MEKNAGETPALQELAAGVGNTSLDSARAHVMDPCTPWLVYGRVKIFVRGGMKGTQPRVAALLGATLVIEAAVGDGRRD